jgi:hypothetical protein
MACRVAKNPNQYALGNAGEKSDREALAAYHAKLVELRGDLEEAKDNNDHGAQGRIQEEIESYTQQIRESRGLGGRLRKPGQASSQARRCTSPSYSGKKQAAREVEQ